ncbi:phosphate ABC transporter substrate-binding protein PstS, partial [Aquiluna sp.]|nr:phosphate ABC transporter substrate-binding protein PstS [Aquiluna sp.]
MSKLIKLTAFAGASVLVLAGCAANEAEQPATSNPTSTQSSTDGSPAELSGTLDGSGASSMAA